MDKVLFFLIFLLPFVIFPIGPSPFETPKVYVAEIGIIILIIWYIVKQPLNSLLKKEYIPFGILGVVGIVHILISPSETLIFGNVFRMQGLFMYLLLLMFAVLSSRIRSFEPSQQLIGFLIFLQLIAVILIEGKVDNRAIGTLGEANSLAAAMIFLLPFLLFTAKGRKEMIGKWSLRNEWRKIMGILMGGIIIVFTGSRSGVIALIIIVVFFILQRYSVKWAAIISILLFIGSLSLPFFQQNQLFENRVTVWQTALVGGVMKPLFGWGPGNTELALGETASRLENTLRYEYVDHTHNIFLENWVTGGIVGLAAFLYLLVSSLVQYIQKKSTRELGILLGLLTMLSFNPLSIAVMLPFWWVIGRSMSEERH